MVNFGVRAEVDHHTWYGGELLRKDAIRSDIGNGIEYVIDSADFKQNKYTPGSHILVVAPVRLMENPVDAIVVMAGSYSNEVCEIIKSKYKGVEVAVLNENGIKQYS